MPYKNMVDSLTEDAAKIILKKIIDELDELDMDDFFGTEGWRRRFNLLEDEDFSELFAGEN